MRYFLFTLFVLSIQVLYAQDYVHNNNNEILLNYSWLDNDEQHSIEIKVKNGYLTSCIAIGGISNLKVIYKVDNLVVAEKLHICDANMTKIRLHTEALQIANLDEDCDLEFMLSYECLACNMDDRVIEFMIFDNDEITHFSQEASYCEKELSYKLVQKDLTLPSKYNLELVQNGFEELLNLIASKKN